MLTKSDVLVGLGLLTLVQTGAAIFCWECNSKYSPDCKDPFTNHTIALTDCSQRFLNRYPNTPASVCRKIIQKVQDEYRYIRGCGWLNEAKEGYECIKRAGTFHILIQYCSCNHNGCNSAPTRHLHWLPHIIVALVLLMTFVAAK